MSNDEAFAWIQEFPGAVTVCDSDGIILAMNDKSIRTFQDSGGAALIGSNLFDCHPEPSRTRLKELLSAGCTNVYTIEKNDVKKMIFQSPWYKEGNYAGFVEISLEIPLEMPHFIRS